MKRNITFIALALCGLCAWATQDAALTERQVRDPKQLRAKLNANATDAESRLVAAGVTTAASIMLTNTADSGTAFISFAVDKNDDAGDLNKLLIPNNGGFKLQSDSASKGTLADILAIGNTGIVTLLGGATLDNSASASELNVTETAVKLTGNATITGTLGLTGVGTFTAAPKFVTTNAAGAVTLTLGNGPTACDAGKAAPAFIRVTIGTTDYVIAAWPITP